MRHVKVWRHHHTTGEGHRHPPREVYCTWTRAKAQHDSLYARAHVRDIPGGSEVAARTLD